MSKRRGYLFLYSRESPEPRSKEIGFVQAKCRNVAKSQDKAPGVFDAEAGKTKTKKTFPSCMRLAPVGGAKSKGSGCPDKLDAGMCGYRVAGQALSVQRRAMQLNLLL